MSLSLITPPVYEPLTISDVCGQIRVDPEYLADQTSVVEGFISAIRGKAEDVTRRALLPQQWSMVLDKFPWGRKPLEIPKPPLISLDSITYLDTTDTLQTLDPSAYRVIPDMGNEPARVIPIIYTYWPETAQDIATVTINFTCGYTPAYSYFDPTVAYVAGAYVVYLGALYICIEATTAGTVPTTVLNWQVVSTPIAPAIPAAIRQWMLLNVANLYETRETLRIDLRAASVDVETMADSLLASYRIYGW
jgi:uncharacterized phiE125 gp8 family phage protein